MKTTHHLWMLLFALVCKQSDAAQKTELIFCRMWGNSISDEGAEAFAEALRQHPSLTNLR